MERIQNDDAAYDRWAVANEDGWVATVYSDHVQVHRTNCPTISGVHGLRSSYPKWCASDLTEIEDAARAEGKEVVRRCTSTVCR
jgi:hypothetical protein